MTKAQRRMLELAESAGECFYHWGPGRSPYWTAGYERFREATGDILCAAGFIKRDGERASGLPGLDRVRRYVPTRQP